MSHRLNQKIRSIRPKEDGLKSSDILVLSRMADYAHDDTLSCFPYQETLANELGCSVSYIKRAISNIKAKGMFANIQHRQHLNQSTIYTFDLNCQFLNDCVARTKKLIEKHQEARSATSVIASAEVPKVKPQPVEDDSFKRIYAAFPKKGKKAEAQAAWELLEDKPDVETVLGAIKGWEGSSQWTKDDGKWRPNILSFITNERWEDAPALPRDASAVSGKGYIFKIPTPSEEAMAAKTKLWSTRYWGGKEDQDEVCAEMGQDPKSGKLSTPEEDHLGRTFVNRLDVASYRVGELGEDKAKVLLDMGYNEVTDTFPKAKEVRDWDAESASDSLGEDLPY